MRLVDGREPSLGDVLAIPLAETGPDFGFECENRSILPGKWRLVRVASTEELRRSFPATVPSCTMTNTP